VGAISCALGSLAALEAIKILSGDGKPAWGRMLTYDGFQARFTSVQLARDPNCPSCATSGS
jgi:molybdopterin/thiamine biosynthesis adenylyltransferase